jgi:GTP diphosphokinase / guanosine-3',5'-bis(diphosphate) 3'-diphosphatase
LPYIAHPMEVLVSLRYVGGVTDENLLIAAVLHDTVEEGGTTHERIRERFGVPVADLVRELTRYEPTPEETQGLSPGQIWRVRSELLLAEIAKMSSPAQAVKLADRLSNLREAFRSKKGKKLERYVSQSRKILEIVPAAVNPGLWSAISETIRASDG